MLILISDAFHPSLPDVLSKHGEVTEDQDRLPEADVVLVRSKTKVRRDYLDTAENLKLVIRGGVGLDNIDLDYAAEKGVEVRNTPEASTTAVAELTIALMIGLASRVNTADSSLREGKWLKKQLTRTELHSKTLGIIGLGRIGLAVAVRARAFQMRVLGWHPDVYFTDWAEICDSLHEMLAEADFVSLHTPLVPETRGMVNQELLAHFKNGAYLINTGRGPCVVEEDVAQALKSGKLGGFATDVWYSDPPGESPLFDAPNTLFTPHIGASSTENMLRIGIMIDRIVGEFASRTP
jgi:D-3-phosphoglycerate dehydrogenase